jgi:ActR/RegA family two-component response regulator
MKPIPEPSLRVAIVDSAPQDYQGLLAAAGKPGVSVHFLSTGNDALRFARRMQSVFWVINTRLLDMSGFDLAAMLRAVRPSAHVFIIADKYRLDDEMQTLTLGLAKYLCKPLEPSWILPQQDSCIPMPTVRQLPTILSVKQPPHNGIPEVPMSIPLRPQTEKEKDDQVILPFSPQSAPRHKEIA